MKSVTDFIKENKALVGGLILAILTYFFGGDVKGLLMDSPEVKVDSTELFDTSVSDSIKIDTFKLDTVK